MVVGDAVISTLGGTGIVVQFRPALGVTVCILTFGNQGSQIWLGDGTGPGGYALISPIMGAGSTVDLGNMNTKIIIDNSMWISFATAGGPNMGVYSGIQIG